MVNQNPQPEIYTTRHSFTAGEGTGTTVSQQVLTQQAHNEEVRIYGLMVNIYDADGDTDVAETDDLFDVSISAGPNYVPSNTFDATVINRMADQTLTFSAPVLILHRQPLQVTVTWRDSANIPTTCIVSITLMGEMYLTEA